MQFNDSVESARVRASSGRAAGPRRWWLRGLGVLLTGPATRPSALAAHSILASFSAILTLSAYYSGGALAPSFFFLTALPLGALVSRGRGAALVWTAIGLAIYAGFLLLHSTGHAFPLPGSTGQHRAWIVCTLTFLALMTAQVASFDRTRNRALRELRRTDQRLREARSQAEAANDARTVFLTNVSHELRTPMTAVLGFTDLALERVQSAPGRAEDVGALHALQHHGQSLLRIVDDILDITKIEAGRLVIRNRSVRVGDLLEAAVELSRAAARARNSELVLEEGGALEELILTDPLRVQQILMSLLKEALQDAPCAQLRLRASRAHDGPRAPLRLDVCAPGAAQTEAAGQPGEQIRLGLVVSRSLAELLGGRLEIARPPGAGTTFRLELPGDALDAAQMHAARTPAAASAAAVADCRVLVIDDNPDNLRLVRHFLTRAGARVTCCEGGEQGLEAVSKAELAGQPFQVVLLDIQMPHMDGHEVARLLRERGFRASIIAFTAHSMATERERCLRSGFDDYATKPIDRVALLELIGGHAAGTAEPALEAAERAPSDRPRGSVRTFWERLVHLCLPRNAHSSTVEMRRLRTLLSIIVAGLPLTLIHGLLMWCVFPATIARGCVGLLAAILPLQAAQILIYRRTGSVTKAVHLLFAYLCVEVAVVAFFSGGVASPATFWSALIPLIGVSLLRWRSVVVWTGISTLAPLVFFGLAEAGVPPHNYIAPGLLAVSHVVAASGLMVQIVVVMLAYAHGRSDAVQTLSAAETWLADAQQQMRRAEQVKSEFLSKISHDLRMPMTGVLGYTDLLQELWHGRDDFADPLELLQTVRRSAHTLLALIDDLLDLSYLEVDRLHVDSVPFAPEAVLCSALEPLRARAEDAGLSFEIALETPIPSPVHGDPARVQQVLRSLGKNALEFTRSGGVRAAVGAAERAGETCLYFCVADTGSGLSEEGLQHLFEPFRQVDPSAARVHGGGGVGLALARRLVLAMQGVLEVESELGRGSVFSVWLPWVPVVGAGWTRALPEHAAVDGTPPAIDAALRGRCILLVEPEPDHRHLIARMLERAGAQVRAVCGSAESVAAADEEPYAVILIGVDAGDAAVAADIEALRGAGCESPILALTHSTLGEARDRYRALGCDDVARKPIDWPALTAAIARLADIGKCSTGPA